MAKYLGEFPLNDYVLSPTEWAMRYIEQYGQIDGAHHKQWVLDQVSRILHGTVVIVTMAKWDDGETELRFKLGEPSKEYLQWVEGMRGKIDENGEYEYDYSEGIAP